jgi:hypothetical protein
MAEQTIAAGFRRLRYGVIDSSGFFIGSTTTAPTNGQVVMAALARLKGGRTLPIGIPDPNIETVTGDDEPEVSFEWDSDSLPSGVFEMSVRDNVFEALAQGTKVHTVGDVDISVLDPASRDSQSLIFLGTRRAKSWKSGEEGAHRWENLVIPLCTVKPLGVEWNERTFSPYRYSFNLSRAGRTGWTTINNSEHGTTQASALILDSDNPLDMATSRGDGATTGFTLPTPPVSGAKTYVYVNDLRQAVTTNYTISGTALNFVVAPAASARIDVYWEVLEANMS